jgi:glucose-1-phosphate cytidylyltransferase
VKVAILAGGRGIRLGAETDVRPKPMVTVGGVPILFHIMRIYAHYGFTDFTIALGYKGEHIKRFMSDYVQFRSDLTVHFRDGRIEQHEPTAENWRVSLIDTGINTLTGGRIKNLAPHLGDETFLLTWGDGVADIDINDLIAFHRSHGRLATLTAVRPPARFGHLELDLERVTEFSEKPQAAEGWINGAFFVSRSSPRSASRTRWRRSSTSTLTSRGSSWRARGTRLSPPRP